MSTLEILLAVILGLLVNEACDISPWLARKVMRWAVTRRYVDPIRARVRAEELDALLQERPGKLFRLATAMGFALSTVVLVLRRSGVQPMSSALGRVVGGVKVFGGPPAVLVLALAVSPPTALVQPLLIVEQVWKGPPPDYGDEYAWTGPARVAWLAILAAGIALTFGGWLVPRAMSLPTLAFAALLTPSVVGLPWPQAHMAVAGVTLVGGSMVAFGRRPDDPVRGGARGALAVIFALSGVVALASGLATPGITIATFAVAAVFALIVATFGRSARGRALGSLAVSLASVLVVMSLLLRIGLKPETVALVIAVFGSVTLLASRRFAPSHPNAATGGIASGYRASVLSGGHAGFVIALTLCAGGPGYFVTVVGCWIAVTFFVASKRIGTSA